MLPAQRQLTTSFLMLLSLRVGQVRVHRSAMGLMAVASAFIAVAPTGEAFYYLGTE